VFKKSTVEMSQTQEYTQQELQKMNKQQLIDLAQSLNINAQGQTKSQLIRKIFGLPPSVSMFAQAVLDAQASALPDDTRSEEDTDDVFTDI